VNVRADNAVKDVWNEGITRAARVEIEMGRATRATLRTDRKTRRLFIFEGVEKFFWWTSSGVVGVKERRVEFLPTPPWTYTYRSEFPYLSLLTQSQANTS
jgi:hypothetical protein